MSSVKRSKNRRQNGIVRDEVNTTTPYLVKRVDCGWVIIRTVVIFYWSLSRSLSICICAVWCCVYIYTHTHTHTVHHNTEYITPISPITSNLLHSQSPSTLPNSIPIIAFGGGDSSVVRAPDSWLKGRGFESLLERRENFLLQGRLSVLTLISVSVPPPCYHSST